jgi:3-hydroxyacyl-[acyl-carrier-protein] dehydratase
MQAVLDIPKDHPAYAGHFPAYPVFPGAALLDAALQVIGEAHAIDLREWQLAGAKFLSALRPGETPTLSHEAANANLIRFTVRVADRVVASGSLSRNDAAR